MEKFTFTFTAGKPLGSNAIAGVVGSGDLEVLYVQGSDNTLKVNIETSVDGFENTWKLLLERLASQIELPAGQLSLHDFGATPGVAKLRIEQCFAEARNTAAQSSNPRAEEGSFIELGARERAKALLDEGSYRELLDPYFSLHHKLTSPWLGKQGIVVEADDGMVIAKGSINGTPTVVAAIEGIFQGGSMGEVSGAKMASALELAAEDNRKGIKTHVVLLLETGGVRLQEANLGLATIADIHAAIVDLKRYTPVVGIVSGTVGCFGGMSIAASLCSKLIVTREARLGLNGPQVIEQEAGIEEYDSRDRPFIWSFTGGEARYRAGFVDALVQDSVQDIRTELIKQMQSEANIPGRADQHEYYLEKLLAVDTTKQISPEDVTAIFGVEGRK